jgi:hypothetical protein
MYVHPEKNKNNKDKNFADWKNLPDKLVPC